MQLRTNRKRKSTDLDDLGYEERPIKTHKKSSKPKISIEKDYANDEVKYISINFKLNLKKQFSNQSGHNEAKHSLRKQVIYIYVIYYKILIILFIQPPYSQGKYKTMNSGKYLYKMPLNKKLSMPKKVTVRKNIL